MSSRVTRCLVTLTDESPSYAELVELHEDIRSIDDPDSVIERYALAEVISEILSYLDFVSASFEKQLGVTRRNERLRILRELERPGSDNPHEAVVDVIHQWERIETYTHEDLSAVVEEATRSEKLRLRE